ncbi:hypothetical protein [Chondromyces apiculatus]|uniref:von Willebrand factor C and EGF domain protein n=1 Tax=Chondromyces apiculatus DSM 436 TaxID=1192034 RepID=A0A017T357_9BACT|nr:hypothetical protein [Chondromyces apiculatus]EYF03285.1 von Willebrand factor C and EGF domain protein [Chondromyces apiculatus DSM 436]
MNTSSFSFLRSSLLALVTLAPAVLTGCIIVSSDGSSNDDGAPCSMEGQGYNVGDSFPSDDGCNTCTCTESGIACTEAACAPITCDTPAGPVPVGTSFPADDGCNTCSCAQLEDGSTTVACTLMACGPACTYNGETYTTGETFNAGDGCNTCTCGEDGNVGCTEMACVCDPEAEWNRDYVGDSPEQCQVIEFDCTAGTNYFANDCGCGCEQGPSCEESYDCTIPADCDIEAIQAECPFSTIEQ